MSDNIFTLLVYSTAILVILTLAGIAESMSAGVSVKKSGPPDSRWIIETRRWVVADASLPQAFAKLAGLVLHNRLRVKAVVDGVFTYKTGLFTVVAAGVYSRLQPAANQYQVWVRPQLATRPVEAPIQAANWFAERGFQVWIHPCGKSLTLRLTARVLLMICGLLGEIHPGVTVGKPPRSSTN